MAAAAARRPPTRPGCSSAGRASPPVRTTTAGSPRCGRRSPSGPRRSRAPSRRSRCPAGSPRCASPTAPRRRARVLLVGHYDTVHTAAEPGPPVEWTSPDVLTGPGVADMKGGILVALAALAGFEASPAAGGVGWELLLTPDEELGAPRSRRSWRTPDGARTSRWCSSPRRATATWWWRGAAAAVRRRRGHRPRRARRPRSLERPQRGRRAGRADPRRRRDERARGRGVGQRRACRGRRRRERGARERPGRAGRPRPHGGRARRGGGARGRRGPGGRRAP